MEILCPSSNMSHIDLAINKKVDAVYGGLKKWNARNKAKNFSVEEYNTAVQRLHSNGIKFYLTLNILLFDEEIDEIICFLKEKNTVLPDAFIVADIGLIRILKTEFPNVPLHFSTQFGIHNVADCKYVESLGAQRAILARELTFDEISNITDNTKLEIETFVWGSQCISFSGLCFFGSLINCGNSNRGKCIITCRDTYQVKDTKGNYLYVPDLNCTAMIDKLSDINVDCVKLEGRRRKCEELSNIIDDIKEKKYDKNQNGYIYGEKIIDNKLFEKINTRAKAKYCIKNLKEIDPYDVFVDYDERYYIYSEYKSDFKFGKNNISFDVNINDDYIESVLYVNSYGEGKTFFFEDNDEVCDFYFNNFIKDIKSLNDDVNLYKVKYIRNIENRYKIGKRLYNEIVKYVREDNHTKEKKISSRNGFTIKKLFVETDDVDIAVKLKELSNIKVIYNIATVQDMRKIKDAISVLGDSIIYKLPIFNFKNVDMTEYYKLLANKSVMFTRLVQLFDTKEIEFEKKYLDYTVYVWNSRTLNYVKSFGINEVTASPELSYEKNIEILENMSVQFIVAGKIPLVYTRQCFSNLYGCEDCEKCRKIVKEIKNVDKNILFKIVCKDDYRMIVADNPVLNDFSYYNNDSVGYRYVTTDQNFDEIVDTIGILQSEDYYKQLKNNDLWKNSYEGNIIESRC